MIFLNFHLIYPLIALTIISLLLLYLLVPGSSQRKRRGNSERHFHTAACCEAHELPRLFHTSFGEDGYASKIGPAGLTEKTAKKRLQEEGKNRITPRREKNVIIEFIQTCLCSGFNLLLWFCVVTQILLVLVFETPENIVPAKFITPGLLSVIILSTCFLQVHVDRQAQKLLESLGKSLETKCRLVRMSDDGTSRLDLNLDSENVVPGDIIFLKSNDKVICDARVVQVSKKSRFTVNQAQMTGESKAVEKTSEVDYSEDRLAKNLVLAGSFVLSGEATVVCLAHGDDTYLGIISNSKTTRGESSLSLDLNRFVLIISTFACSAGLICLLAGYLLNYSLPQLLIYTSSAVFAQIPEGLLPTCIFAMIVGAFQLTKSRCVVRKAESVETCGCSHVALFDKTGTLTTGKLSCVGVILPPPSEKFDSLDLRTKIFATQEEEEIHHVFVEKRDWSKSEDRRIKKLAKVCRLSRQDQNTTDREIFGFSEQIQIEYTVAKEKVYESEFSSEKMFSFVVRRHGEKTYEMTTKASPDCFLRRQLLFQGKKGIQEMDESGVKRMREILRKEMEKARRVVFIGNKFIEEEGECDFGKMPDEEIFRDLIFIGGLSMEDPVREGVKESIERLKEASIRPIIVTGDHLFTARAVAKKLQIFEFEEFGLEKDLQYSIVEGHQIVKHSTDENFWRNCTRETRLFCRCTPRQKTSIVQAYQRFGLSDELESDDLELLLKKEEVGSIVLFCGDGVNDSEALRTANVSFAVGSGSELAKESADIVLQDDNFKSIPLAVEHGRLSAENLQKSIMYCLVSKTTQIIPILLSPILKIPIAITISQMLLVDLFTDIFTMTCFAFCPPETNLMKRNPRHPKKTPLLSSKILIYSLVYMGFIQTLGFFFFQRCYLNFFLSERGLKNELIHSTTSFYWALVCGQVAVAIATQTKLISVTKYGLPNIYLNTALVLEIVIALALIYGPYSGNFGLAPLRVLNLLVPIGYSFFILFCEETRKFIRRRLEFR